MSLILYAHPFSSYCQKALTALYENDTPFEYRVLGPDTPEHMRELTAIWPVKRFPVLVDDGRPVIEASIIEYLGLFHPGPVRLIPDDPRAALEVRFMDRFFDNYVSTPQQKIVFDAMRKDGARSGRRRRPQDARYVLRVARPRDGLAGMDRRRAPQPRGLRRRAVPVLRGLVASHLRAVRQCDRVPQAAARAALVRARSTRGGALSAFLFPLGAPDRD